MEQDLLISTHGRLRILLRMHQSIKSFDIVVFDIIGCIICRQVAYQLCVSLHKECDSYTGVRLLYFRQVTLKFFEALDKCLFFLFPVSLLVGVMSGTKLLSERVSILKVCRDKHVYADH